MARSVMHKLSAKLSEYQRHQHVETTSLLILIVSFCILPGQAGSRGRVEGQPPRIIANDVRIFNAFAGQDIILPCMVTGDPPPEIKWLKDGSLVGPDWKRFQDNRVSLRIRNINVSDGGLYVCHAVNGFGVNHVKLRLVVHDKTSKNRSRKKQTVKPIFSEPVKMRRSVYVKPQGGSVNFRCKAKGKPRPSIRWFKDGNLTKDANSIGGRSHWTLTLRDIDINDSGVYTCKVWNAAGEISFDYTLRVVGNRGHDRPMIVPPHPVNTTALVGEKTSLQCKIRSSVIPTIKWIKRIDQANVESFQGKWPNNSLKIDKKLYLILPSQEMMRLADGSYLSKFVIESTEHKDAGMYICLGANTMGYSFRYAYLTIGPDSSLNYQQNNTISPLPLSVVVGIPSGLCLLIFILIALAYIFKRKANFRTPQLSVNTTKQKSQYLTAAGNHGGQSQAEELTVQNGLLQVQGNATVRFIGCKGNEEYVNPTHTESHSGSEGGLHKKTRFYNDVDETVESDGPFNHLLSPPAPPPSQYSHTSSRYSSSKRSSCSHICNQRSRSHSHHHHYHRCKSSRSSSCS